MIVVIKLRTLLTSVTFFKDQRLNTSYLLQNTFNHFNHFVAFGNNLFFCPH